MNPTVRQGFIGIVVQHRECIEEVNRILTKYGKVIRGRIGVPNREDESAVIGLITEGTNDEIGALTGKLGNVRGIIVKSALVPVLKNEEK
ncbi:MAG: CopG family transcriptional regulator [Clostridia bacterium]|nr:CopG family transcriptional regulator [Clostridia bacterium]